MCGIVGCFSLDPSGISHRSAKAVRDLAIADTVRGYDGTGVMWLEQKPGKDDALWYIKKAETACSLMDKREWGSTVSGGRFAVVHNRAATIGSVTDKSTHPFSFPSVTGVHNGTVSGWRYATGKLSKKAKMDSEAIMEALSNSDPDTKSVSRLLAKLDTGAYSLVWYDSRVQKLRFARNDERPMNFVITDDQVFFGSELRMMEWILSRNRIRIKSAFSTATHHIIDIPVGGGKAEVYDYTKEVPRRSASSKSSAYGNYASPLYPEASGRCSTIGGGYSPTPPRCIYIERAQPITYYSDMDAQVRRNLTQVTEAMLGTRLSYNNLSVYAHTTSMYNILRRGNEEVTLSPGGFSLWAPVHVVHVNSRNNLYGYVMVDGAPVYASLIQSVGYNGLVRIKELLEQKREAVLPKVLVRGIKLYHTGEAAYYMGAPSTSPSDIIAGGLLDHKKGSSLQKLYGEQHPDMTAQCGVISWNTNWRPQ